MSAERLREAATAIREDWDGSGPRPMGTAWHQERDFHLAVADWLHNAAHIWPFDGLPALAVADAYLGATS